MRGRHLRGALVASLIVLVTPVVAIGTASADPSDPPLSHCEASTGVVSGAMQLLANLRALDPLASFYSVDLVYRTLFPQAQAFTGPSCTTGQVSCDDQWPCTYSVKLTAKSLYGRAAARIDLYGLDQLGNWIPAPGSRNCTDGNQKTSGAKCSVAQQVFTYTPIPGQDNFLSFRAVCQWQQLAWDEVAAGPTISQCIIAAALQGG